MNRKTETNLPWTGHQYYTAKGKDIAIYNRKPQIIYFYQAR